MAVCLSLASLLLLSCFLPLLSLCISLIDVHLQDHFSITPPELSCQETNNEDITVTPVLHRLAFCFRRWQHAFTLCQNLAILTCFIAHVTQGLQQAITALEQSAKEAAKQSERKDTGTLL
jgi:hypothetical protein